MIEYFKRLRKIAYKQNDWNDINLPFQLDFSNIALQTIDFFKNGSDLIYPAKSYFVAIVYASCFQKFFNQDFFQMLDDVDLLPDDVYYMQYSKDKNTYNIILDAIGDIWKYKSIEKTVSYFKKEFIVDLTKDYGVSCKNNR